MDKEQTIRLIENAISQWKNGDLTFYECMRKIKALVN